MVRLLLVVVRWRVTDGLLIHVRCRGRHQVNAAHADRHDAPIHVLFYFPTYWRRFSLILVDVNDQSDPSFPSTVQEPSLGFWPLSHPSDQLIVIVFGSFLLSNLIILFFRFAPPLSLPKKDKEKDEFGLILQNGWKILCCKRFFEKLHLRWYPHCGTTSFLLWCWSGESIVVSTRQCQVGELCHMCVLNSPRLFLKLRWWCEGDCTKSDDVAAFSRYLHLNITRLTLKVTRTTLLSKRCEADGKTVE